jgi:hypothetical protein
VLLSSGAVAVLEQLGHGVRLQVVVLSAQLRLVRLKRLTRWLATPTNVLFVSPSRINSGAQPSELSQSWPTKSAQPCTSCAAERQVSMMPTLVFEAGPAVCEAESAKCCSAMRRMPAGASLRSCNAQSKPGSTHRFESESHHPGRLRSPLVTCSACTPGSLRRAAVSAAIPRCARPSPVPTS